MRWNLRMTAAQQGIWKSTELRRRLAEAGLEISAGKMSALWTGAPISVRLDDLDVICAVLACTPNDVLIHEPNVVAVRRPARVVDSIAEALPGSEPRRTTGVAGRHRPVPPA